MVKTYQAVVKLNQVLFCLLSLEQESKDSLAFKQYSAKCEEFSVFFQKLIELIENTIDFDSVERHEYLIKPEFDSDLKSLSLQFNVQF